MKFTTKIFLVLSLILAGQSVEAQITIDEVDAKSDSVKFKNQMKSTSVENEYFSRARYKAERAAIRKERNYLEFSSGVQGALTAYNDPWIETSGGDNSIALVATLGLKHVFTKNLFTIETKFNAKLGYNRMKVETTQTDADGNEYTDSEGIWFKNQDEFELSVAPSFKMTKNWSYGAIAKFRSQFINGYVSRTEQRQEHLKSKFMTPGYFDLSLGVTYKCPKPKFPVTINLSPIALNATFASNEQIRKINGYTYGIEDPDKSSKWEGGSSIQIDFDRTFGKTEYLRYRTMIYGFYGWISDIGQENKISDFRTYREAYKKWEEGPQDIKNKPRLPIHPVVRWTNILDIKATKYLTTTISFELYYNRAQHLSVQTKTLLSVGLTYTFKNK